MKQHLGRLIGKRIASEDRPIVGWRSWRLTTVSKYRGPWWNRVTTREAILLRSTWSSRIWQPHQAVPAHCGNCHIVLMPGCECGIWASKTIGNLIDHGAASVWPRGVYGQVALWGPILEYAGGFRAAIARPVRIWLSNHAGKEIAANLAKDYGIEVSSGTPDELLGMTDLTPRIEHVMQEVNHE